MPSSITGMSLEFENWEKWSYRKGFRAHVALGIGYIQRERQGISGRKGNSHRGIGAQEDTPGLREAPFMLLVCVREV